MRNASSGNGLLTVLVVLGVFAGFGYVLYSNAQGSETVRVVIPTQIAPTEQNNPWSDIFQQGFGSGATPYPTITIPETPFVAPTLMPEDDDAAEATPFQASDLLGQDLFTPEPVSVGATPTLPPPTAPLLDATEAPEVQSVQAQPTIPWQPPALEVPINKDPLGRDHYFFTRPIDSDGQNFGVDYYPYGSRGRNLENPLRIHHGIDMPNPIGTTIRAAADGVVCFASTTEEPTFQGSNSYGYVVVIEHDAGWEGFTLYTLYAHLQGPLVFAGDRVAEGDPIGLNGNTGTSTGAHLHFEVRLGDGSECGARYGDTYNPTLWMAPYVGHGTIAGQLVDTDGNMLPNETVTLRDWGLGINLKSTGTYEFDGTANQINPDPNWQENFVFGDVPVGTYEVITVIDGVRISSGRVNVVEGMTTFVLLEPEEIATGEPIPTATPTPES